MIDACRQNDSTFQLNITVIAPMLFEGIEEARRRGIGIAKVMTKLNVTQIEPWRSSIAQIEHWSQRLRSNSSERMITKRGDKAHAP